MERSRELRIPKPSVPYMTRIHEELPQTLSEVLEEPLLEEEFLFDEQIDIPPELENELTLRYRATINLQVPAYYIQIVGNEIVSIHDLLSDDLESDKFSNITNVEKFKTTPEDLAMVYIFVQWLKENVSDESSLKRVVKNEFQEIKTFIFKHLVDTPPAFDGPNELFNGFQGWHERYELRLDHDQKIGEKITHIQSEIASQEQLKVSPYYLSTTTVTYDVYWGEKIELKQANLPEIWVNTKISEIKGIDLFDKMIISDRIPYIQLNLLDRTLSKLWNTAPHNVSIPLAKRMRDTSVIYISVRVVSGFKGDGDSLDRPTQEAFVLVTFDLRDGTLSMTVSKRPGTKLPEEEAIALLRNSAPFLNFKNHNVKRITGSFNIYNIEIDEPVLLHLVLVDERFSSFLYAEESSKTMAEKKRLVLRYRSLMSDILRPPRLQISEMTKKIRDFKSSATFRQQHAGIDDGWNIKDYFDYMTEEGIVGKLFLNERDPYLVISFNKTESETNLIEFINVLSRLLFLYKEVEGEIKSIYEVFRQKPISKTITKISSKPRKISRNDYNRERAPDIFVDGYPGICQGERQPIVIDDENTQYWVDKKFESSGKQVSRQYLDFPKDNRKIRFICPNDSIPYPGVVTNKHNVSNIKTYPYLPCCFSTDNINNPKSNYSIYIGRTEKKETHGGREAIKILREIKPKQFGTLISSSIVTFLDRIFPGSTLQRMGVSLSSNSFLACVFKALSGVEMNSHPFGDDIKKYNTSEQVDSEKILEVSRRKLNLYVNPELLKQELYDVRLDQIEKDLVDSEITFDPYLYYRAVEEIFNINIFVLTPYPLHVFYEYEGTYPGTLEIPRSHIFHSRPQKDRRTILIFKHIGKFTKKRSQISFPVCELIVKMNGKSHQSLYDIPIGVELYRSFTEMNKVEITPNVRQGEIKRYDYQHIDWLEEFDSKKLIPINQWIDDYGKLRILNIKVSSSNAMITIYVDPSSPLNLPSLNAIFETNIDIATKLFGVPSSGIFQGDQAVGLWFIHRGNHIAIPIIPTNLNNTLLKTSNSPFTIWRNSGISELRRLRKIAYKILQLVRWIFNLKRNRADKINVEDFVNQYIVAEFHESPDYDLSRLTRHLPNVSTPDDGIRTLIPIIPDLFKTDTQGAYISVSVGLKERLIGELKQYLRWTDGINFGQMDVIDGFFQEIEDFTFQEGITIFLSELERNRWLSKFSTSSQFPHFEEWTNIRGINETSSIYKQITNSLSKLVEPYLFRNYEGSILLIQNLTPGITQPVDRAINSWLTWEREHINLGPEPSLVEIEFEIQVNLYELGPGGTLEFETLSVRSSSEPRERVRKPRMVKTFPKYVTILVYDPLSDPSKHYGVMLPFS